MGLIALGLAFLHAIHTFVIPIRYAVRHKLISRVVDEVRPRRPTRLFLPRQAVGRPYSVVFSLSSDEGEQNHPV